jgi:hypothetical protein
MIPVLEPVLRIRNILVRIRIRGSAPVITDPNPAIMQLDVSVS